MCNPDPGETRPREPHGNGWSLIALLAVAVLLSGCAASLHGKERFAAIQAVAKAREATKAARWDAIASASASMTPEGRALALALGAMADGMDTHRDYNITGWDSPAEANITNPTMLLGVGLGALLKPSNTTTNSTNSTTTTTTTSTPTTITNTTGVMP